MSYYLAVTTVFLLLWGLLWRRDDFVNFLAKVAFIGLGIWSLILYMISTGYIIHK